MPFWICALIGIGIVIAMVSVAVFLEWITNRAPDWVQIIFSVIFAGLLLGGVVWLLFR